MARTYRERTRPIETIQHHPDDQETIDAAHANRRAAVTSQVTLRIIDLLPLSLDQRSRLALLLLRSTAPETSGTVSQGTSSKVRSESGLIGRNQVFGFLLALIAFSGAIVLTLLGKPEVGAMFLSTPVVALIFAFVVRRY